MENLNPNPNPKITCNLFTIFVSNLNLLNPYLTNLIKNIKKNVIVKYMKNNKNILVNILKYTFRNFESLGFG